MIYFVSKIECVMYNNQKNKFIIIFDFLLVLKKKESPY